MFLDKIFNYKYYDALELIDCMIKVDEELRDEAKVKYFNATTELDRKHYLDNYAAHLNRASVLKQVREFITY